MSLSQSKWRSVSGHMEIITATWAAETSGAFTSADITGCRGMYLLMVRTIPNSGRPPTADYDITLKDDDGVDVAGALLTNRSATAAEDIYPAQVTKPIQSDLTVAITGNVVDRAAGTIKLYLSSVPTSIVAAA